MEVIDVRDTSCKVRFPLISGYDFYRVELKKTADNTWVSSEEFETADASGGFITAPVTSLTADTEYEPWVVYADETLAAVALGADGT